MSRLDIATLAFLAVLLSVIAVWDIVALALFGADATISRVIRAWGRAWPLLPILAALAAALLWVHLFGELLR